jgi:hypothetical protein
MIFLLDGCVPSPNGIAVIDPHTTTRLLSFDGTVLDERTHAPIAGAKIFLSEHPKVSCTSDSSGHFSFKEIANWHWGFVPNPAGGSEDLPHGEQWGYDVTISHTNYVSRQVGFYHDNDRIVLLKKLGEPSEPRPWLIFTGRGEIVEDMGARQYLKPGDIHITSHYNNRIDTEPSAIHIGFARRVYDPQISTINGNGDVIFPVLDGLDWDFRINNSWGSNLKDSSRKYKLEFTP